MPERGKLKKIDASHSRLFPLKGSAFGFCIGLNFSAFAFLAASA
jgi:hypothetical protein